MSLPDLTLRQIVAGGQWLPLGPVSDSLLDKSGESLLIPILSRVRAQGEKLGSASAVLLGALGSPWCDESSACCEQ